jgi:hypothetical protein
VSGWLFKKKSITMHGDMNVKIWQIFFLAVFSGETVSWFKVAAA